MPTDSTSSNDAADDPKESSTGKAKAPASVSGSAAIPVLPHEQRGESSGTTLDQHPTQTTHDDDDPSIVSKSQRKREATAVTQLAQTISELSQSQFDALPMDDKVRQAITELRRIKSFGARKRQLHYAGKVLRHSDPAPLLAILEQQRSNKTSQTQQFQRLEQWRDDLLGDKGSDTLTDFLTKYPQADRQRLRQLMRNSAEEGRRGRPPKSARELFKVLRETTEQESE